MTRPSLLLASLIVSVSGFVLLPTPAARKRLNSVRTTDQQHQDTSINDPILAEGTILDLKVLPHRPLGCTVEESLGQGNYVFVAKVVPESNAAQAGILPGDVIVGVTDIFGDVADVTYEGVEKVKGLVASRPDYEPLELRILRGTQVLEQHEEALVELCANISQRDKEADQCVLAFLQGGFAIDSERDSALQEDCVQQGDDSECLVDNLYNNLWADELPAAKAAPLDANHSQQPQPPQKAKPWSSRSSPSGTWVRDPATGKLKNLDTE